MVDRLSLGDLAFAVLLALPLAAFARPATVTNTGAATMHATQVAAGPQTAGNGRISVLG